MTALVQNIVRIAPFRARSLPAPSGRVVAVLLVAVMAAAVPQGWSLIAESLSEAYLSVAVFVAGTLILVYGAERMFSTDLGAWLQRYRRWQVPVAALLGGFPGCGGAIVAVTQYTRGYLSFGAVVATLTSTMGDAMFLLLAREPHTAMAVWVAGVGVGALSGYVIDAIHGEAFMRPAVSSHSARVCSIPPTERAPLKLSERIWIVLMVPGLAIGLLAAFQMDGVSELSKQALGVAGALLAVSMWVSGADEAGRCESGVCGSDDSPMMRSVIQTTNFVTAWVAFAFVAYELAMAVTGFDLEGALRVAGPWVPAMAILIGFIPGCGPQIMVTSLYLSGSVPLSAQLGNALANDGDALFPAIAAAPKAAVVATLYSAIPAAIVAYGWYGWME